MQVKSIAECSKGPALSDNLSFKAFALSILSGSLRQVLLYVTFNFDVQPVPFITMVK